MIPVRWRECQKCAFPRGQIVCRRGKRDGWVKAKIRRPGAAPHCIFPAEKVRLDELGLCRLCGADA